MLLRAQMRTQRRGLVIGIIAGLAWTACKVSVPLLVQAAIDQGITPKDQQKITEWALIIVGVGVISALLTGLRRYWAFREARWSEAALRHRMFAHLQRLHFAYHDDTQTGQLMSRANTDLQQIVNFVVMIPLTVANLRHGPRLDRHHAQHQRGAGHPRGGLPATAQRAREALLHQAAPGGDGRAARVGRARRGRRGDGVGRARRQGLRRRAGAVPEAARRRGRPLRRVAAHRPHPRPLRPAARPAAQHRPGAGARLRRPPRHRGPAEPR